MLKQSLLRSLKLLAKQLLFPGLDLHTRCRYRFLPRFFTAGTVRTLDAGFGNGALSFAAYRLGNCVLGVNYAEREVRDTAALFERMKIPRERIELKQLNIYDLKNLPRESFDQIICSETLEHITRDAEVVQTFAGLLRQGGRVILCCPYALHPEHALGRTNEPETGYHVRDGYTVDSYRALLEPAGLRITHVIGLGSPFLCWLDGLVRKIRNRPYGDAWALPVFLLLLPLTRLDRLNPRVPFSLAVVAQKA